ncbi:hypothetical protein Pres01_40180 [Metapseudomonas resinovorans]|nr:hypothetical protein Pres01_40180 [Pseudomonas resinovorans]
MLINCTLAGKMPETRAMLRQLQRTCLIGGWGTCSNTRLSAPVGKLGLRPRPGTSINPLAAELGRGHCYRPATWQAWFNN